MRANQPTRSLCNLLFDNNSITCQCLSLDKQLTQILEADTIVAKMFRIRSAIGNEAMRSALRGRNGQLLSRGAQPEPAAVSSATTNAASVLFLRRSYASTTVATARRSTGRHRSYGSSPAASARSTGRANVAAGSGSGGRTTSSGARPTPTLTPPPRPTSSTSIHSSTAQARPQIRDAVKEVMQDFDQRHVYRGWHLTRFLGAILGGSVICGGLFYDDVIRWLSGQGSELARQTIQDKELQKEVDRVTKVTTNALLNDPEVTEVTVEFLLRLLEKRETRANVVKFLSAVIGDPTTVNALANLIKDPSTVQQLQKVFNVLLQNPEIQQSLNIMVGRLLADPGTRRQFENLIVDLFKQQNVKSVVAEFFGEVLRYDPVIEATRDSLSVVVEQMSNDGQVHKNLASAGSSAVKRMVFPPLFWGGGGRNNNQLPAPPASTTGDAVATDKLDYDATQTDDAISASSASTAGTISTEGDAEAVPGQEEVSDTDGDGTSDKGEEGGVSIEILSEEMHA